MNTTYNTLEAARWTALADLADTVRAYQVADAADDRETMDHLSEVLDGAEDRYVAAWRAKREYLEAVA